MPSIEERFKPQLQQRQQQHLYRRLPLTTTPQQAVMQINGVEVINFSSNDYLGLANHPQLTELQNLTEIGYGSGAAHLVTGHHLEHHLLEDEIADWLGVERALLFSTGYMANLAVQQTLMQKGDWILADKLNHASLIDGARYAEAELKRYPHRDLQALEKRLQQAQAGGHQTMMVSDGVFSMDGDLAKLPQMVALQKKYQAWLFIDDAHGFGVMGSNGRGCFEHFGLTPDSNTVLMGTLGKAFGTFGAFVAGSETLIETLIQFARPYIYTTAMPVANAHAARKALQQLILHPEMLTKLHQNIDQFRQGIQSLGLRLMPSPSAIQPIMIGEAELALEWSERLKQKGFWVSAIRPPTVPKNTARLRITLSADHSCQQINALLQALDEVQRESTTLRRHLTTKGH